MGRSLGEGRLCRIGTGKWRLDYRDAASRRHRVVIDARTKAEAEKERRLILARRDGELRGAAPDDLQDQRLSAVFAPYLRYIDIHGRPTTRKSTKGILTRLIKAFGDRPLRTLTKSVVTRYMEERIKPTKPGARPAAPMTVNRDLTVLKSALNYAKNLDLIARNPIADIPRLPVPEDSLTKRRALREHEVTAFLEAVRRSDARLSDSAIPQEPLWTLLVERGPRWSETAALRWADVHLAEATVVFRSSTTKGRRTRTVPLPPHLVELLEKLRRSHALLYGRPVREADLVFLRAAGETWEGRAETVRLKELRRYLRAAGIEPEPEDPEVGKIDVHALRKTAATRMMRAHIAPHIVVKVTGHKDQKTLLGHYEGLGTDDVAEELKRLPSPMSGHAARGPRKTPDRARTAKEATG